MKNKQTKENRYDLLESSPSKNMSPSKNQLSSILNRIDLLSKSPSKKTNQLTPSKKKNIYIPLDLEQIQCEQNIQSSSCKPTPSHVNLESKDMLSRKDGGSRRRQYDMRMENIDKISSQITNLLNFVKNGEYKKPCVEKCSTPQKKNDYQVDISSTKRQNRSYLASAKNILNEEEQMKKEKPKKYEFITEGVKQRNKSRRVIRETEEENNQHFEKQTTVQRSKLYENHERRKSPLRKYEELNLDQVYEANFVKERRPISSLMIKEESREETSRFCEPKEQKLEKHSKQQYFKYNDSPAIENKMKEIMKSQYGSKTDREGVSVSYSNIDDEINKIKSRIQSSEETTRKMEEKYLHTVADRNYPGKLYNVNDIDEKNARIRKKYIQATQQFKKIDMELEKPQPKTREFELKVYPCQTNNKEKVITKVSEKLSEQIKLDQKLRICREKFALIENSDKWVTLKKILASSGFHLSEQQLQEQLTISSNEYNPFTIGEDERPLDFIEQIAECFVRCENYWHKQIHGCIRKNEKESSGFKISEIDLDKKGYLGVEDFVCFINLNSSHFFRNRDVLTLFRRFLVQGNNKSGVEYQTFQKVLCN